MFSFNLALAATSYKNTSMGNCCLNSDNKKIAYVKREHLQDRVKALGEKLLLSTKIVIIELKRAKIEKNMKAGMFSFWGPYFSIKCSPADEIAGDQLCRSSHKPKTKEVVLQLLQITPLRYILF